MQIWEKTKVQCLVRHSASGIYYARTRVRGKLIWRSLKTDVFSVGRAKLPKTLGKLGGGARARARLEAAIATIGDAAQIHLENVEQRVNIKATTKHYWTQVEKSIFGSWPGLATRKLGSVTDAECQAWASSYAKIFSPTRYNNAIDFFRALFELGIKAGVIFHNPTLELGKMKPRSKHLELPTREQFAQLVKTMRTAGGRFSQASADLIEFLAYSGARINEARFVTWNDIDQTRGVIWIHGDPELGTKNSERRQVPIIPALGRLLEDLRTNPRPTKAERQNFVIAVGESQKALDRGCGLVGCKRITHHDLRHLFATTAIESGIDVPTVSKWLGHKDGGALAMKTYGHLRDSHSLEMAKKINF